LKILLLEYITAGGLCGLPLPDSLLREGLLMRDALLSDFSEIADVEILTTYDVRIVLPKYANVAVPMDVTSTAVEVWQALLHTCDVALVIAPESDGVLSKLTQLVDLAGVKNLGSMLHAVDLSGNKYKTYHALKNAHILTIPTYTAREFLHPDFFNQHRSLNESFNHGYVIKPIDGAGCEDAMYFVDAIALQSWLCMNKQATQLDRLIVQPHQPGIAASISMLCKDGAAWVLSCNQQLIEMHALNGPIQYKGCLVNGLSLQRDTFTKLAQTIAAAIRDLNGYVGVDVIINDDHIYVVEINPRITTSYIGLRESLKCNPAKLILDLGLCEWPSSIFKLPENMAANMVEINLNE
jgi:predicted ATP-grasp superfamily ATP-dependent carboligase